MGQIRHGSAKATPAVRVLIQRSKASNAALSRALGINVKTVAKWRKREHVEDARMGPRAVHSTVLGIDEEAVVVAFRRHTLLPLDDCLYALQPTIPHLTRSSLHRGLQRHGISRLPEVEGEKPKKKFKRYPIGYFLSTSRKSAQVRVKFASSWRSTALPNSPMLNCMSERARWWRSSSCEILSKQCLTGSIPYSPTTASSSPIASRTHQPSSTSSAASAERMALING